MSFGPRDVLVAVSLDFEDVPPASSAKSTVTRLEHRFKASHPNGTRVFIDAQSFVGGQRNKSTLLAPKTRGTRQW
jgi:hypothetical protein